MIKPTLPGLVSIQITGDPESVGEMLQLLDSIHGNDEHWEIASLFDTDPDLLTTTTSLLMYKNN